MSECNDVTEDYCLFLCIRKCFTLIVADDDCLIFLRWPSMRSIYDLFVLCALFAFVSGS